MDIGARAISLARMSQHVRMDAEIQGGTQASETCRRQFSITPVVAPDRVMVNDRAAICNHGIKPGRLDSVPLRSTIVLKAGAAIPLRVGDIPFTDDWQCRCPGRLQFSAAKSVGPQVSETCRRQFSIADGVLDIAMPEPLLEPPGVGADAIG
jgi:hypothetical protein